MSKFIKIYYGKEEWLETIKSLPNNKVGGSSNIIYEIIKESCEDLLELLRHFYNILLINCQIGIKV